ncbi:MAG TPA: FtsQ-type POTRA domain-containing protein [Leptolyngbyaceae cyanobacterium]
MTDLSSISANELRDRRKTLRRQRRLHLLQGLWQIMAMSGLTVGIFWLATRPLWLIRSPEQIEVSGNQLISEKAIQSLVTLDYPQPLLKVEPAAIAQQIESRAPITQATVVRHLFPPKLEVTVQERVPVAVTLPPAAAADPSASYIQDGLLDADGVWMPQSSLTFQSEKPKLPALKVQGMQEQYRIYWPEIYQAVIHSPVKISQLDWRDPNNLILHTELGLVHTGPYSQRFGRTLATLDQMRDLTKQFDRKQIAYIDLTNPEQPFVQVKTASKPNPTEP